MRRAPDAWCLRSALVETGPWREHSDNQAKLRAVLRPETIVIHLSFKLAVKIERWVNW
jgi:hypothetical protein